MIDLSVENWTGFYGFYEAASVLDFMNDKDNKNIKESKWRFWKSNIDGLVDVRFTNVDLYFGEDYLLKDSTGEIDLKKLGFENAIFNTLLLPFRKKRRPGISNRLQEEGRHYEVDIIYDIKNDTAYLKTLRKFGPGVIQSFPLKDLDTVIMSSTT